MYHSYSYLHYSDLKLSLHFQNDDCFVLVSLFSVLLLLQLPLVFPTHYLKVQPPPVGYFDNIPHSKIGLTISTSVVLVLIIEVFHLNIFQILGNLLSCVSGTLSKSTTFEQLTHSMKGASLRSLFQTGTCLFKTIASKKPEKYGFPFLPSALFFLNAFGSDLIHLKKYSFRFQRCFVQCNKRESTMLKPSLAFENNRKMYFLFFSPFSKMLPPP